MGAGSTSVELRGSHEAGGAPRGVGRASLPRGFLEASLTSTPSLLDCFCSKNNSPKVSFRLIFLFCETLKQGKKQELALGSGLIG